MVARTVSAPNLEGQASYSLFANGGGENGFEPPNIVAVDHANQQFCQWVADVVVRHGGMMTSANLGSTLVSEDPERYATIKAVFGGLCGLLTRYPQRFALVNNQPLNHVAVIGGPFASHNSQRPRSSSRASLNEMCTSSPSSPSMSNGFVRSHSGSESSSSANSANLRLGTHQQPLQQRTPQRPRSNSGGSSYAAAAAPGTPQTARSGGRRVPQVVRFDEAAAERDEIEVVGQTKEILQVASEHALKAVDLANALRNRVGVDVLGRVREVHGGLLSLLERHADVVTVRRVPKHDIVALAKPYHAPSPVSAAVSAGGETKLQTFDYAAAVSGRASRARASGLAEAINGPRHRTFDEELAAELQQHRRPETLQLGTPRLEVVQPFARLSDDDNQALHGGNAAVGAAAGSRRSSFADDIFHQPQIEEEDEAHRRPPPAVANIWTTTTMTMASSPPKSHQTGAAFGDAAADKEDDDDAATVVANHDSDRQNSNAPSSADAVYASSFETYSTRTGGGFARSERSYSESSHGDPFFAGCGTSDIFAERRPSYHSLSSLAPVEDGETSDAGSMVGRPIWEPPEQTNVQSNQSAFSPTAKLVNFQSSPPKGTAGSFLAAASIAPKSDPTPTYSLGRFSPINVAHSSGRSPYGASTSPPAFLSNHNYQQQQLHHHQQLVGGGGGLCADLGRGSYSQRKHLALDRLMSEDYVPTQRWPKDLDEDAALVSTVLECLDHVRGCSTINKLRSALKQRHNLPRSVKSVPLRAFLASYSDRFTLDGTHVYLREHRLVSTSGGNVVVGSQRV